MVDTWESTGLREWNFAEKPCRILNTLELELRGSEGFHGPYRWPLAFGGMQAPIWWTDHSRYGSPRYNVHMYHTYHMCIFINYVSRLKTYWHTNTCDKMCTSLEISPLASVTLLSLEVQIAQVVQVARCKGWAVGAMGCNFLGKVQ